MGLGGFGGPARRAPPTSLKEPARLRHQPGARALIHLSIYLSPILRAAYQLFSAQCAGPSGR